MLMAVSDGLLLERVEDKRLGRWLGLFDRRRLVKIRISWFPHGLIPPQPIGCHHLTR
jgi:hypothetical protein